MGKNEGILLVELMVYLVLFTGITIATIRWAAGVWQTSCYFQQRRIALINLMAAHDLLVHDIQQAPKDAQKWKLYTPHCLIWQGSVDDIGWLYDKESLWRIQGIYTKGQWHKKSKNLAAPAIKKVCFTYHAGDNPWIDCTLENSYGAITTRIACDERVLRWQQKMDPLY